MLQRHTLPRIVIGMKIRPAVLGDRDAILQVHALAIRQGARGHYSPQQIAAWEAFPAPEGHAAELRSGHVFVAEDGGAVVGYGRFDSDTGELEATYVLPELRGRGIGAALLAETEDRARRAGFDSIHVSASMNAVAFYAHAGFQPQVERCYELPGGLQLECLFMIKWLEPTSSGGRAG